VRQQLIRLAPRPLLEIARGVREAYRRIGYLRARWPRPFGTRPPVTLAVCAIFRDEARYLAEWLTFHRVQGVERFYLYDNLSTDDWRSELGPEIAAGIVEAHHWPDVPGQASAYEDCLRRHRTDTRWIAFIDIDEFLFSPTGKPLPELLREFDNHPGVVVNWRVYGTNGWEHPPDGLVIDNYPLRAPDDHPANRLVKSIVYPRRTLAPTQWEPAHLFRLRGNPVGEDKLPVLKHARVPPTTELLRINHYYAKSEEQSRRKAARPSAVDDAVGWWTVAGFPPPAAVVGDDSILQFRPELLTALATRSIALPSRGAGLAERHGQAEGQTAGT
jgi:hypothetical protein